MTEEYRTREQFISIMDNAQNGNWSTAFKQCVEYGFYAKDLIDHFDEYTFDFNGHYDERDLIYLAEGAQKLR